MTPAAQRNEGKFRRVILDFYASAAFKGLADATKRQYERGLKDVDAKWGSAPISVVEHQTFAMRCSPGSRPTGPARRRITG